MGIGIISGTAIKRLSGMALPAPIAARRFLHMIKFWLLYDIMIILCCQYHKPEAAIKILPSPIVARRYQWPMACHQGSVGNSGHGCHKSTFGVLNAIHSRHMSYCAISVIAPYELLCHMSYCAIWAIMPYALLCHMSYCAIWVIVPYELLCYELW